MNKKVNGYQNIKIIVLLSLSILSLIFWETVLVFPIKLFVVLLHEISHAVMAFITGGQVTRIFFSPDLSGITQIKGGNLLLIASSGYLGSLLIGLLLFISGDNVKTRKWVTAILAWVILVVATNLIEDGFQIFLSLLIATILFIVPRYVNEEINFILFKFIGLTSCLYVIADIKQDLLTTTLRETDTQILEYLTDIPALLIGAMWFIISVSVVYFLIRRNLLTK